MTAAAVVIAVSPGGEAMGGGRGPRDTKRGKKGKGKKGKRNIYRFFALPTIAEGYRSSWVVVRAKQLPAFKEIPFQKIGGASSYRTLEA